MNKLAVIIGRFQHARTIKELEELKKIYYKDYGKFLTWDLMQIKEVYKNRMEKLKL